MFQTTNLFSGIAISISSVAFIISLFSYRLNSKNSKIEHRNKLNDYIAHMYEKTSNFALKQHMDNKTRIKLSNEITISEIDQLLYYIDFLTKEKLVDIKFLKNNIGLICIISRHSGLFKKQFYLNHKSILDQLELADKFTDASP